MFRDVPCSGFYRRPKKDPEKRVTENRIGCYLILNSEVKMLPAGHVQKASRTVFEMS